MTENQGLSGRRVRLIRWHVRPDAEATDPITGIMQDTEGDVISVDDNITVPPGTEGTIDSVDGGSTVHVDWDNGRRLGLLTGVDEWELLA